MKRRRIIMWVGAWTLAFCVWGHAEEAAPKASGTEDEVKHLRDVIMEEQQVIADCMKRIDKLEATKGAQDKAGINGVKLMGDFRYRYDYQHQDPKALVTGVRAPFSGPDSPSDRDRHRLRLRLGFEYTANEEWTFGGQICTTSGGDPVTYNQTLTSGFSKKNIALDLAYFDYHPLGVKGLKLQGGKILNPFYAPCKTQLIWDHDLTPEGLAVTYQNKDHQPWEFSGTAAYFVVNEQAVDNDAQMFGLQGMVKYNLMEEGVASIMGGVSYYDYTNTKNYPVFVFAGNNNFGNSLNLAVLNGLPNNGFYADDFNLVEGFTEVTFPVGPVPVTVFGDYVVNLAATDRTFDTDPGKVGWAAGLTLGKCVTPHSWALRYEYRDTGRNAVVGAFNDSDFGNGGTNSRGHVFNADYMLFKNVKLSLTYFLNHNVGSDWLRMLGGGWGPQENIDGAYQRVMLDLNVKF